MNFNKVLQFLADNNIQPAELFALVEKVRIMDLSDEEAIRNVIREVAKVANRPLDKAQENRIVKDIMKNGINDNLFNLL
ncbi:MAG TPA: stage VI sporulation protein F [Bacilli bacterium]|nr:stage VI sporulation protein F [Bacilli bacterium]